MLTDLASVANAQIGMARQLAGQVRRAVDTVQTQNVVHHAMASMDSGAAQQITAQAAMASAQTSVAQNLLRQLKVTIDNLQAQNVVRQAMASLESNAAQRVADAAMASAQTSMAQNLLGQLIGTIETARAGVFSEPAQTSVVSQPSAPATVRVNPIPVAAESRATARSQPRRTFEEQQLQIAKAGLLIQLITLLIVVVVNRDSLAGSVTGNDVSPPVSGDEFLDVIRVLIRYLLF